MVTIDLLKESCGHLGVNEHIKDLRVVVWSELSHCLLDLLNFLAQNFFLEGWTTDSISVHDNKTWLLSLISLNVGLE